MKLPHALLIAALLTLFLAGCINVNQNIEINPNGSGKFALDFGISEGLMAMALEDSSGGSRINTITEMEDEFKSDNPYVRNVVANQYNQDGFKHYSISADITDMTAFLEKFQEEETEGIQITLEKLDNGNLLFRQVLDISSTGDEDTDASTDDMTRGLVANAFAGNYWTLTLKIPNVVNTNGVYDKESSTVTWNVPMADLFNNQQYEMTAEFRPTPAWARLIPLVAGIICIGLILLLAVGLILVLLRRKGAPQSAA